MSDLTIIATLSALACVALLIILIGLKADEENEDY